VNKAWEENLQTGYWMNTEFTCSVYPSSRRKVDSSQTGWHSSDGPSGHLFRDSLLACLS